MEERGQTGLSATTLLHTSISRYFFLLSFVLMFNLLFLGFYLIIPILVG